MKKLILGYPAALNQYWSELEKTEFCVWLIKSRESRRLIELQKPSMRVIDLTGWCRERLAFAGLIDLKMLEESQELALLRHVLKDQRIQSLHGIRQVLNYPGSQKRLLSRLKRSMQGVLQTDLSNEFGQHSTMGELRLIYEQYQLQAGVCDEQLILQRFVDFLDEPALDASISHWASSLLDVNGKNATIVLPGFESFNLLQQEIVFQIVGALEKVQIGLVSQQYGSNEKFNQALEKCSAIAGIELCPLPQETEKKAPLHYRFENQAQERAAVVAIVDTLRHEQAESPVVIYTPGNRTEVEQLASSLSRAELTYVGLQRALVECPEVRTAIDIAGAICKGWPVYSLVDLLRNPELQFSGFNLNLTRRKIDQLASEICSLGEITGLSQIQETLLLLWDEATQFNFRPPNPDYRLQAIELLRQIESVVILPEGNKTWSEWSEWLNALLNELLGAGFISRLSVFSQMLSEFGKMQSALGDSVWQFPDFIAEVQLQASQKLVDSQEISGPDVIFYYPCLPEISILGDWVNFGMSEGHFPSRNKLREGLRNGTPMYELFEIESNSFDELLGMGFGRPIITSAKIDDSGVEQESSGLLRDSPVMDWNRSGYQGAINSSQPLKREASRFFTRAVSVYNNRNVRDSRYLGQVSGQTALNQIAHIFSDDYGFSPTSLESASLCPFQFFAGNVLKINELEVNDDLETDYLTEGNVIHAVLEDLHTCLPQLSANDIEAIRTLLPQKIDQHFHASDRVQKSVASASRWQIQRRRIEHRLASYVEQLAKQIEKDRKEYDDTAYVVGVELNTRAGNVSFGPLVLTDPESGRLIKVHGRIDRIDRLTDGDFVQIRIIDYKTGSKIDKNELLKRVHLQLPLYGMLLNGQKLDQAQSLKKLQVQVSDIGFWYLKKSLGGYKSIGKTLSGSDGTFNIERLRPEYEQLVIQLVRSIRNGEFFIKPKLGKCEEKCLLQEVCRIHEIREHPKMKL